MMLLSMSKSSLVILFGILVGYSLIQNFRFLLMNNDNGPRDDVTTLYIDIPFKKNTTTTTNNNSNNVTMIDDNLQLQQQHQQQQQSKKKEEEVSLYGGQPYKYLNTSMLIKKVPNRQHRLRPEYSPFMLNTSYIDNIKSSTSPIVTIEKPVRIRILLFEGPKISFRPSSPNENNKQYKLIGDEILNIAMDGFKISPYFDIVNVTTILKDNHKTNFTLQEDDDIVWIIEMRLMEDEKRISIPERTLHLAKLTREYQLKQLQQQQQQKQLPLLRIIFMDYRDRIHKGICFRSNDNNRGGDTKKELVSLLGNQNVREMRQQFVQGRDWSSQINFTKPGHPYIVAFQNCWEYFPLHSPYTVRTDYANHVLKTFPKYLVDFDNDNDNNNVISNGIHNNNNNTASPSKDSKTIMTNRTAPDTIRPIDVAHFWSKNQYGQRHCHLRDAVTDVVLKLNNTLIVDQQQKRNNIRVIGDFISTSGRIGRTSKQDAYIDTLLQTKIVVVAQRDSWEDHYRFFESIIGGALVMTDPMISLPEGYVNGTNIIIYDSLPNLKSLILYYIQNDYERIEIARNGWLLALNHHRSYHWMERLFFGQKFTT